jgi:diphthine synthase
MYKFGRTATLVNPRPGYRPTSSLDVIRQNLSMGMHSLVLLDTEPAPMEAGYALDMLSEFGHAVVLSRLGEEDEKVSYGKIGELAGWDLGKVPFCIIIPAKLHSVEEEFLATLRKEHI